MGSIVQPNSGVNELAIASSWQRCRKDHKLSQMTPRPLLRLQDSEIGHRLDQLLVSLGGETREIDHLAKLARHAHRGLVVADTDCTLLMSFQEQATTHYLEPAGISAGYCWREPLAATNAISMALGGQKAITISGNNHYYKSFRQFACTGAPLFDQHNQLIGALAIAGLDYKNPHNYIFYQYILSLTAAKIQARLFKSHYSALDIMHVSLSKSGADIDESINALCAVNSRGEVVGLTNHAAELLGYRQCSEVLDQTVDDVFGKSIDSLANLAGTNIDINSHQGAAIIATPFLPGSNRSAIRTTSVKSSQKKRLSDLAGHDKYMIATTERASELYRHGVPLLLQGETGSGKQALVKVLHAEASFKQAPFITINCAIADISDKSVDTFLSELDSVRSLHRTADQEFAATVYLKAIDRLSQKLQMQVVALLNEIDVAIQGVNLKFVNALRVVASVQDEPAELLGSEQFCPELFHRLNGACFRLSSLRERSDLRGVISQLSQELAQYPVVISDVAYDLLLSYQWPGNFRELLNAIRFSLLCGNGKSINDIDLPSTIRQHQCNQTPGNTLSQVLQANLPVEKSDAENLRVTLESSNWNVSKAARRLGISRATIYRKIKDFEIVRSE
ncbi:sigma-54-dependent Fis family transcriptional regulator [Leucothrix mucor]|uniref:sigma-54-dependent Fis family transcriptional regulator n=1 Tax=Leucothrix mucor TaxID=45248 RepID=UPI0003B62F71|nr:sigma 54-interacting transcriptional regulator [Leucothrix mucor]